MVDTSTSRFDCILFEGDVTTVQEDILFCEEFSQYSILPTRFPIGPPSPLPGKQKLHEITQTLHRNLFEMEVWHAIFS